MSLDRQTNNQGIGETVLLVAMVVVLELWLLITPA